MIPSQRTQVSYRGVVDSNRQLVEGKAQSQKAGVQDEQNEKDTCVVG